MAGPIGRAEQAGVEATAVIPHRDHDSAGLIHRQAHQHRTRSGMLTDVVQAFLNDTEQRQFVDRRQDVLRSSYLKTRDQTVLVAEVTYQLGQRRKEAKRVQIHRTQRENGAAEIDDGRNKRGLQLV